MTGLFSEITVLRLATASSNKNGNHAIQLKEKRNKMSLYIYFDHKYYVQEPAF